jgi:hypothetical protein
MINMDIFVLYLIYTYLSAATICLGSPPCKYLGGTQCLALALVIKNILPKLLAKKQCF